MRPVHTVTVKFGGKCNFRCRHCCQGEYETQVEENLTLNPDVITYIKEKATICMEENKTPLQMRLWGGEPLMYLREMQELVESLRGSPIKYRFTTNGSLLTPEIVDFVNREDIRVSISNDGPDTARIRRVNTLENPVIREMFNRIKERSVNFVLTAHSQVLYAVWDYLDGLTTEDTGFNLELLIAMPGMPPDLYNFGLPGFKTTMKEVTAKAKEQLCNGQPGRELLVIRSFAVNILLVLLGKVQDTRMMECRQVYETVNLDLAGNIYPCHNFGGKLGDIYLPHAELLVRYNETYRARPVPEECARCEVYPFCRGHCPFIEEGAAKRACCDVRRIFLGEIYRFVTELYGEGTHYEESPLL